MNMPKIPYLIEQYNKFDRDLQYIQQALYKFPHMSYKGATILNTVPFLNEYATRAINIATRIDDYAGAPANEDNNFCLVSDDLCKMYHEIAEAGNNPLNPSTDPREAFDPEEMRKILEKIIRVYGLCEIYERCSLAKMLRGCVTLLLNGGILPVIIGVYPAVQDSDVPATQDYAEDPNAQGVEPKLCIVASLVAEQIHFSAQEKADIAHAEEVRKEQERNAAELEVMISKTKDLCNEFLLMYGEYIKTDPKFRLTTEAYNCLDLAPTDKDGYTKTYALTLLLHCIRTAMNGNPFQVLNDVANGAPGYFKFTDCLTPQTLATAIELIGSGFQATMMETHSIIDKEFCEGWSVGDTFILSN